MRVELGALCTHRGVYVADAIALGGDEVDGLAQQYLTIDVERLGSRVGEVVAYVAHVGGAEQGVADGVDEHVGVAVSEQAEFVVEADTAEPQLATLHQFVDIIS